MSSIKFLDIKKSADHLSHLAALLSNKTTPAIVINKMICRYLHEFSADCGLLASDYFNEGDCIRNCDAFSELTKHA